MAARFRKRDRSSLHAAVPMLLIGALAAAADTTLAQAPATDAAQPPGAAQAQPAQEPAEPIPAPATEAAPTPPAPPAPGSETTPDAEAADTPSDAEVEALIAASENETELTEDVPSLHLYGFADFSYGGILHDDDTSSRVATGESLSFAVGNINLYAAANLTHGFRSLFEIRFLYLPNGDLATSTGTVEIVHTTARDYNDGFRPLRWGAIEIERAWVEYQAHGLLVIRAGQWLTPVGIWNVDHGSPMIIPASRPYVIGGALFPERQTGLELHGSTLIGDATAGYHLTLSNGRGSVDEYRDADTNKALGGRIFLSLDTLGTLTLGVSGYVGEATDAGVRISLEDPSRPGLVPTIENQYDELAYAADLLWQWKGLHLQSEVIVNETAFTDGHRAAPLFSPIPGQAPDIRRWGVYGLIGYRLPWLGIMPYVLVEHYDTGNSVAVLSSNLTNELETFSGGLNVRPIANVALKASYSLVRLDAPGTTSKNSIHAFFSQVAWSF